VRRDEEVAVSRRHSHLSVREQSRTIEDARVECATDRELQGVRGEVAQGGHARPGGALGVACDVQRPLLRRRDKRPRGAVNTAVSGVGVEVHMRIDEPGNHAVFGEPVLGDGDLGDRIP
jgi:hypothetical protein